MESMFSNIFKALACTALLNALMGCARTPAQQDTKQEPALQNAQDAHEPIEPQKKEASFTHELEESHPKKVEEPTPVADQQKTEADETQPRPYACMSSGPLHVNAVTLFKSKQSKVSQKDSATLDMMAQILLKNPDIHFVLTGHAEENEPGTLALERAEAVQTYFTEKGVELSRVSVSESVGVCPSNLPSCCEKGRCVSYEITDSSGEPYINCK